METNFRQTWVDDFHDFLCFSRAKVVLVPKSVVPAFVSGSLQSALRSSWIVYQTQVCSTENHVNISTFSISILLKTKILTRENHDRVTVPLNKAIVFVKDAFFVYLTINRIANVFLQPFTVLNTIFYFHFLSFRSTLDCSFYALSIEPAI